MSKFQQDFFNKLINKYGFFVEEYSEKQNSYIALKYIEDGIYAVIISKEDTQFINANEAQEYLEAKNRKFALHNVILVNGNVKSEENVNFNRIFVDGNSGRILQYDVLSEPIAKIIAGLLMNNAKGDFSKSEKIRAFKISDTPTNILIAINLVMFLISAVMSVSLGDIDTYVLVKLGAKHNALIENGEYYRLLTSMFLHGGIMHLVFNMYALYSLGNLVGQIYGTKKYLIIYFVSGIFASFTSYELSPYVSVGASGAIFGLLGSCLVFAYKEKERIGKEFLIDMVSVIILNVIIGFTVANIDNVAHFGGLFAGCIIAIFIYNKEKITRKFKK